MTTVAPAVRSKKITPKIGTPVASIRQAFADTLWQLADNHPNIYVVNADLKSSLRLDKFAADFPERFIECGVAEANAAAVAAGLAQSGKIVFLTSFACFSPAINWAVIKQSICYNRSNVKIIGSHAGLLSAGLGATHQMLEDIALMRPLPGMEVFAPADAAETAAIVRSITFSPNPAYLRLLRPSTPVFTDSRDDFTIGRSRVLKPGKDITVIAYGPVLSLVLEAAAALILASKKSPSLEIINLSSIKPLDNRTITDSIKKTGRLLVIEDHQKAGGLGEAVAALALLSGLSPKFIHLAVNDRFGQSASDWRQLYDHYGLGVNNIIEAVNTLITK